MRAIISERSKRGNHLRAIEHGHTLVTLNTHNFAGVPGLVLAKFGLQQNG